MEDLFREEIGLRLQGCHTLADLYLQRENRAGDSVRYATEHLARQVAETLVRAPQFFTFEECMLTRGVEVRFDCTVVTRQELRAALKNAYAKGAESGRWWTTQPDPFQKGG